MDEKLSYNNIGNHKTEEVTDIIAKMPTSFGLSVTAIILILVLSSAILGWVIKYPEIIKGEITVTGRTAPIKIISYSSGKIRVLKNYNSIVKIDEPLAVIQNTANFNDVLLIDSLLQIYNLSNKIENVKSLFPQKVILGELNSKYFIFYNSLIQYVDYQEQLPFDKQYKLGKKLQEVKSSLTQQNENEKERLENKFSISKSLNKRDSLLFEKQIIGKSDLEKSNLYKIGSEQELKSINREIVTNDYLLNEAVTRMALLNIQKKDKERELAIILFNSYFSLLDGILEWQKKFVVKAPINGVLEYMNFVKNDDFVQQGQELFSIIPNKNDLIGQLYLPDLGSGRIKIGQKVIIKLNNYPYIQYGFLEGKIKQISLTPNRQIVGSKNNMGIYLAYIELPKGLETNYGTKLNFQFDMLGIAEVVTDDQRLIQRLFDNLKYRIK